MQTDIARLDLEVSDFNELLEEMKSLDSDSKIYKILEKAISNKKDIVISNKKRTATKKASQVKTKEAIEKIENAINILRMENKPITINSVRLEANVAYVTAKKHKDFIDSQEKLRKDTQQNLQKAS